MGTAAAALAALVLRLLLASFAGLVLLALMGIVWLLGIAALAVEGWRAKDQATQWVAVLIGAYGILGTLLGYVAERGADLGAILTWAIVALLLPALGALLLLASGLWVERRRLGATLLILLVLLTVTIAVFAGLSLTLSSHWALAVSDTGRGIPEDAQGVIFEPFRQVDDSATREYGGAGLGLSIVKHLSQAFGGSVVLQSHPDEGSTFRVSLPSAD